MAPTNQIDIDRWVDARLAALTPDEHWRPDASARLAEIDLRRVSRASHRPRWIVGAVVGTLFAFSLPGTRAFGARCLEACVAVTSRAAQRWRADEPAADRSNLVGSSVGNLAPDLLGFDAHGTPLRLSALRGRVVVLNFWASWCGPCRAEIPRLNELQTRYRSEGLAVIGISVDEGGWAAVTSFVAETQAAYTLTLANDEVTEAYGGINALPTTFVIDRDGRIVRKSVGELIDEHGVGLQLGRLF